MLLSFLFSSPLETVSLFAFATAAAVAGFTLRLATRIFFCSLLVLLVFSPVVLALLVSFFKAINFEDEASTFECVVSVADWDEEDAPSSSSNFSLFFSSSSSSFFPNAFCESPPSRWESSSNANLASRFLSLPRDFRIDRLLLIVKSDSLGRFTIAFADETIAKGVGILLKISGYIKRFFTNRCCSRWE